MKLNNQKFLLMTGEADMEKKAMSATYQAIALEDFKKFVFRGFHALRPKQDVVQGEIVFNLFLSPNAGIRIWSSIGASGTQGAGVGDDAIRVQLFSFAKNKPLKPGKAPIVKRTQGWKDSLQDRVEEAIEDYDAFEEQIEAGKFVNWGK
jgi:hypothetical protein